MVNFIVLMLILLLMFLSCYMLWDSNQVFEAADAKNYEAYMPSENHTKSFEELQKINPDVFGWIRINDTNVNYPLLQAEDDDTYMNTDAEGNYSLSGSIFLHCANAPDFSDFNNLIYGHHMEKHKMFGDVGLFTEKKYFDEHPYGNLFFDGKDHGIEFYALLQADAYNERLFSVCPETSEAKQEYLQEITDNALHKRNLDITEEDHLVLLITCTSEMTNGRNILVGRLTEQIYPEKGKPKNWGTGIDQIRKLVISVPILFWLLLLLLILLLLDQKLKKNYKIEINQDDTVIISYTNQGVYRVTINTKDNAGVEYINIPHSKKNGWTYLEDQDKIEWTFKESDFSNGDYFLRMPEFHVNRGYRLVHMTVNGYTMTSSSNGYYKEVPTSTGTNNELSTSPGSLTIITQMTNEYTSNRGDEKDCSYAYAMRLKVRNGDVEDYNFNLAPYSTGNQALTARLYTDQRRNSEGLDVVMWDYEKKELVPVKDNDVINMDAVKYDGKSRRQVRIFFVKPKSGYVLTNGLPSSTGVSYGLPHGDETGLLSGRKSSVNAGKIDTMTETSIISGNNEFYIYTKEWKAAKDAAKKAGYTTYLAWGGADPSNKKWFLYAASFEAASRDLYVHYNSGVGEGVLPKDALVNNIPYNQETNNQNKPMQSYGKNPSTYKGARRMGTTFVMGEKFPEPTCEGYEFLGWKLKNSSGKLSDTLYKHGDLFTIAEDNYAYADNTNLPVCSWTNFSGYQIVAQWKKIDTKRVEVKHWLKVPNSTEKLEKTTPGTISFATENESVKVFAKPEANGTFPGYVFDTEDSRNELEKEVTNNASADTITLNLYYKPTQLTVSKIVKGYTLDANKAFTFTIQAQAPSGTDSSGSTIQAGQIYIKKSDGIKSLDFTDNKATFTLKDKESVEISCLPMGWTYTVEEADPGENFKTTYQRNEESAVDGRKLSFIMDKESEDIKFVNASKVAPPVTGRSVKNNSFVLLAVLVLGIGIVGYGCFKRMKRKH